MKPQQKSKHHNCPYCTPTKPDNKCVLANAKTVIDGKEYSACCSNPKKIENKESKDRAKKPKKTDRKK